MSHPDLVTGEPSLSAQLHHHRGRGPPNITRVGATTDRIIITRSDASPSGSTSDRNTDPLHLRLAPWKPHFHGQGVDADKIRPRAIHGDERRHLQRQALLVIGGSYRRFLDSDLAVFGRRRQLDRWKWTGRTVRPHVDIHPHTNIRVVLSARREVDTLHLSGSRGDAHNNSRSGDH